MAKKSVIEREKKRKSVYLKFSNIRSSLKSKVESVISLEEKLHYQSLLQNLPRNSSPSRIL